MKVKLPPLNALRAFEATARHLSMTRAAGELHVTPGAISLQIRELETALGLPLFLRRPRALVLTPEGMVYATRVQAAFALIREATAEVTVQRRAATLSVTCTASVAAQWLLPRLAAFQAEMPGVDIQINSSNRLFDLERDGIDLAIRHGTGRYDGLSSVLWMDDALLPVLSPELVRRAGAIEHVADLADIPLLHDENTDDWRKWLSEMAAEGIDAGRGAVFSGGNGAIEAALAGLGAALVRHAFVEREIAAGRLVAPFRHTITQSFAYYLVSPFAALRRPEVVAFRDWLLREVGRG
jgi:LysR family transcriptional regulator, glycine cleavage system transcriptional activator